MSSADSSSELHALTVAVSAQLSNGSEHWRSGTDRAFGREAYLLWPPTGPALRLTRQRDRITVRALLPDTGSGTRGNRVPAPAIGLTARATSHHVARHITQRLLPLRDKALAEHHVQHSEARAEQQGRAHTARRLALALGAADAGAGPDEEEVVVTDDHRRTGTTSVIRYRASFAVGSVSFRARVNPHGASVDLELSSLSPEQAERIAVFLTPCLRGPEHGAAQDAPRPPR